jgi:hypothetical protein
MKQDEISNTKKSSRKIWFIISGIVVAILCLCGGVIAAIRISSNLREQQYVGKPTPIPDEMYVKLRTAALHRTAAELKLNVDPNSNLPYGVIMDWNIGQATSTIVSFSTGDASMYYSTGGGWLGGYSVENVNSASKKFVIAAGEYVGKLNKVSEYPMPPVGFMRFYIITPQGVYGSGDVDSDKLIKDGVNFSSLNDAAQYLIHEISLVPQK